MPLHAHNSPCVPAAALVPSLPLHHDNSMPRAPTATHMPTKSAAEFSPARATQCATASPHALPALAAPPALEVPAAPIDIAHSVVPPNRQTTVVYRDDLRAAMAFIYVASYIPSIITHCPYHSSILLSQILGQCIVKLKPVPSAS